MSSSSSPHGLAELRRGHADRFRWVDARGIAAADVVWREVRHDGEAAGGRVHAVEEFAGEFLFEQQRLADDAAAVGDAGRVRAEEERCRRDAAVGDEDVHRQVVAFDAPSPRFVAVRGAEEDCPVVAAVTVAVPALSVVEDVFQRHDRRGLRVGVRTEHCREHAVHRLALVSPQIAEDQARSYAGGVSPAVPEIVVGDRAHRVFALVGVQQTDKPARGIGDIVQHASDSPSLASRNRLTNGIPPPSPVQHAGQAAGRLGADRSHGLCHR